jgi:hypothetical protein
MTTSGIRLIIIFILLLLAVEIVSQDKIESNEVKNKKNSENIQKEKGAPFKIDGLIRFRGEAKANYGFVNHINDEDYVGSKSVLGVNYIWSDKDFVRMSFQHAGIWGGFKNSTSGLSTAADDEKAKVGIKEAYINTGSGSNSLKIGRQQLVYGDQRLVGHLDWTNIGRSHDGIKYTHSIKGKNTLDVFSTINKETNSNDLLNTHNTGAAADERATFFSGIYDQLRLMPGRLGLEPYFLWNFSAQNSEGNTYSMFTPGIRITNKTESNNKTPKKVAYDYSLEFAYQFGDSGIEYDSGKIKSISAYAFAVDIGYKFPVSSSIKLRPGCEFDIASGDNQSDKKTITTFNNLYHTNHLHYGVADLISWQNMMGISASLTLIFSDGWLKFAFWNISKAEKEDYWYSVKGGDASNAQTIPLKVNKTGLYNELDLTASYQFKIIRLEGGGAFVMDGDAINTENKPLNPVWIYLMAVNKF